MKEAVDAWLSHTHKGDLDPISREAYELQITETNAGAPEQPEPLAILYQLRRFGIPYWSGGLFDQPYLLTLELNACVDAEIDFEHRTAINLKLQLEYAAKQTPQQVPPDAFVR